jgi:hypothetical protein
VVRYGQVSNRLAGSQIEYGGDLKTPAPCVLRGHQDAGEVLTAAIAGWLMLMVTSTAFQHATSNERGALGALQ